MSAFIANMPKVELHMHVEGSLEADMLWHLAHKNGCALEYQRIEALKQAYRFNNLSEFVDMFMLGTRVIQSEQDLYDVCMAYFDKCVEQNIQHTEVHCDIRTYVDYGYPAEFVINALHGAFVDAEKNHGITGGFMPCFIRHLGNDVAKQDLELMLPHADKILAIGLSAKELGFPPSLFKDTFKRVRDSGIHVIAHAGEEAPASYIWSAIRDIGVQRIDHGIRCLDDPDLVDYLVAKQLPLTVCPQSNVCLNMVDRMSDHVLPEMLDKGLNVSVHSDDPAHFDAYLTENLLAVHKQCHVSEAQIIDMAHNAIEGSFATAARKNQLRQALHDYCQSQQMLD